MSLRSVIGTAVLAATMGGCAFVDPVDSRYDIIGRSLAKARNESLFLNIVRASNDDPLNFVTINQVTPGASNTSAFGLPMFLLGPTAGGAEPIRTGTRHPL